MSPKVLVVGRFNPDSFVRWLSDGFVYAGCRVVRTGILAYEGYPSEELPRLHDAPQFPPGQSPKTSIDLSAIYNYFCERGFTPDLIHVDCWDNLLYETASHCDARIAMTRDQQLWVYKYNLNDGIPCEAIEYGADPYVFRLSDRKMDPTAKPVRENELPKSIGARAALYRHAPYAVLSNAKFREALCSGCPAVFPEHEAEMHNLMRGDEVENIENASRVKAYEVMTSHTWMHRAIQVLKHCELLPGPVPRL